MIDNKYFNPLQQNNRTPHLQTNTSLTKEHLPYKRTPHLQKNTSLTKEHLPYKRTPPLQMNTSLTNEHLTYKRTKQSNTSPTNEQDASQLVGTIYARHDMSCNIIPH